MRKFFFFIILLLTLTSCGRAEGDDSVCVVLKLRNISSSPVFVETNFPLASIYGGNPASGVIQNKESITLFSSDALHRIRTYDDYIQQFLTYYPQAEVRVYSVNEDGTQEDLLTICSLINYPAIEWGNSYDSGHLRFKTDDYPFWIIVGAAWDGERIVAFDGANVVDNL